MFLAGPIDRPKPKQPKLQRRSCSRPGQVSDLLGPIVLRSTQKVCCGCSLFQSAAVEREHAGVCDLTPTAFQRRMTVDAEPL